MGFNIFEFKLLCFVIQSMFNLLIFITDEDLNILKEKLDILPEKIKKKIKELEDDFQEGIEDAYALYN